MLTEIGLLARAVLHVHIEIASTSKSNPLHEMAMLQHGPHTMK